MKQYHELLEKVLREGTKKEDRTGTGTRSIFGYQMRFNLAEGFPLVTTKKVHLKSVITELLWFISGSQNERELAKLTYDDDSILTNTIWTPNCVDVSVKNPERFTGFNVGNMYGVNWRMKHCEPNSYVKLKRKTYNNESYTEVHVQPNLTKTYKDPKRVLSSNNGWYSVIGKNMEMFVIRFDNTGSYRLVKTITKNIKDLFAPSVEGVGYMGFTPPKTITANKLHRIWQDMLIRVYNPRRNHSAYENICVCSRWHSFKNFYFDCFTLWGFQEFVDSGYKHQLDKDYFGANIYSPETCIFISRELNLSLNGGGNEYKIYLFEGQVFYSIRDLQEYRGFSRRANLPEGITVLKSTETHVYRPKIFIDQLQNCIDLIKNNPDSRRIIIDSWNPRNTDNAVLSICHPFIQFYVAEGRLNLCVYQRSQDLFLGCPFNIASYALLLMMVAQVTGLEAGDFVHTIGDAHIYENHVEQVELQLSREIRDLPNMQLNPNVKHIDDFSYDDFTLSDYNPHPPIKAKVAI